jgi:hypothetical protein
VPTGCVVGNWELCSPGAWLGTVPTGCVVGNWELCARVCMFGYVCYEACFHFRPHNRYITSNETTRGTKLLIMFSNPSHGPVCSWALCQYDGTVSRYITLVILTNISGSTLLIYINAKVNIP